MADIECLWCKQTIELPGWLQTDSYDGEVRCINCSQFMQVKFVGGVLQKRKRAEPVEPEQLTAIHLMQLLSNLEGAFREYLRMLKTRVKAELEFEAAMVNVDELQTGLQFENEPISDEEVEARMLKVIREKVKRALSE